MEAADGGQKGDEDYEAFFSKLKFNGQSEATFLASLPQLTAAEKELLMPQNATGTEKVMATLHSLCPPSTFPDLQQEWAEAEEPDDLSTDSGDWQDMDPPALPLSAADQDGILEVTLANPVCKTILDAPGQIQVDNFCVDGEEMEGQASHCSSSYVLSGLPAKGQRSAASAANSSKSMEASMAGGLGKGEGPLHRESGQVIGLSAQKGGRAHPLTSTTATLVSKGITHTGAELPAGGAHVLTLLEELALKGKSSKLAGAAQVKQVVQDTQGTAGTSPLLPSAATAIGSAATKTTILKLAPEAAHRHGLNKHLPPEQGLGDSRSSSGQVPARVGMFSQSGSREGGEKGRAEDKQGQNDKKDDESFHDSLGEGEEEPDECSHPEPSGEGIHPLISALNPLGDYSSALTASHFPGSSLSTSLLAMGMAVSEGSSSSQHDIVLHAPSALNTIGAQEGQVHGQEGRLWKQESSEEKRRSRVLTGTGAQGGEVGKGCEGDDQGQLPGSTEVTQDVMVAKLRFDQLMHAVGCESGMLSQLGLIPGKAAGGKGGGGVGQQGWTQGQGQGQGQGELGGEMEEGVSPPTAAQRVEARGEEGVDGVAEQKGGSASIAYVMEEGREIDDEKSKMDSEDSGGGAMLEFGKGDRGAEESVLGEQQWGSCLKSAEADTLCGTGSETAQGVKYEAVEAFSIDPDFDYDNAPLTVRGWPYNHLGSSQWREGRGSERGS